MPEGVNRRGTEERLKDMGSVMLVAAVMVSLALGVLAAYGVCCAIFAVLRMQSRAGAKQAVQAGAATVLAEQ